MKPMFAIRFNITSLLLALSYSVIPYQDYDKHITEEGHTVDLAGFSSQSEAEVVANSFVGLTLSDDLVKARMTEFQHLDEPDQTTNSGSKANLSSLVKARAALAAKRAGITEQTKPA